VITVIINPINMAFGLKFKSPLKLKARVHMETAVIKYLLRR